MDTSTFRFRWFISIIWVLFIRNLQLSKSLAFVKKLNNEAIFYCIILKTIAGVTTLLWQPFLRRIYNRWKSCNNSSSLLLLWFISHIVHYCYYCGRRFKHCASKHKYHNQVSGIRTYPWRLRFRSDFKRYCHSEGNKLKSLKYRKR